MTRNASFKEIAEYYDLIYKNKDYEKEVNFIENIFENIYRPRKILEIGCGTGSHTKILLERGYNVTGMDFSEDMLKIARKKCSCRFIKGDIRHTLINEKFDACVAMFNVIGYITRNSEIMGSLSNIYSHLKSSGIFIFDVWNGLAVLRILPERRVNEIENDKIKIIRYAIPNLRSFENICEINYKLVILNKENKTFNEINEKHVVRFYFPQEIKHYLEDARFEVLKICPFLDLSGNVDERCWNMTIIAKTVEEER